MGSGHETSHEWQGYWHYRNLDCRLHLVPKVGISFEPKMATSTLIIKLDMATVWRWIKGSEAVLNNAHQGAIAQSERATTNSAGSKATFSVRICTRSSLIVVGRSPTILTAARHSLSENLTLVEVYHLLSHAMAPWCALFRTTSLHLLLLKSRRFRYQPGQVVVINSVKVNFQVWQEFLKWQPVTMARNPSANEEIL